MKITLNTCENIITETLFEIVKCWCSDNLCKSHIEFYFIVKKVMGAPCCMTLRNTSMLHYWMKLVLETSAKMLSPDNFWSRYKKKQNCLKNIMISVPTWCLLKSDWHKEEINKPEKENSDFLAKTVTTTKLGMHMTCHEPSMFESD